MGKIIKPDGTKPPNPINMKEAQYSHKLMMIYLKHNFGDQCELCGCDGCTNLRNLLGSVDPN